VVALAPALAVAQSSARMGGIVREQSGEPRAPGRNERHRLTLLLFFPPYVASPCRWMTALVLLTIVPSCGASYGRHGASDAPSISVSNTGRV